MKKLVLVVNDLPATGKSTLSEVLVSSLSRQGIAAAHAFTHCSDDAEERITESPNAIAWDFEEESDLDKLVALIDENDAVVVDVGTGDTADLHEFAERMQLFDYLGELAVELTLAIPLSDDPEKNESLVEIAEAFSDNADYLVVRQAKADDGWEDSYANKVMSYLSAIEITAPSANGPLEKALVAAEFELHQALANRDELPKNLKAAVTKWEKQFGDIVASQAHEYIFPDREEHRARGVQDDHAIAV